MPPSPAEIIEGILMANALDNRLSSYEVDALHAAIEALQRPSWEPIEDAPIDGTVCWLYHRDVNTGKHVFECRPYCYVGSGGAKALHAHATHFMIPEAPR